MKKQRILISILIFIVFSTQIYSYRENSNSTNQVELKVILKKCAEYCERLTNSALFFVCKETIKEEIYQGHFARSPSITVSGNIRIRGSGGRNIERNAYVYDYQLIKKGEKVEESRILLEENGKKKYEKNALLKTKRFYSKRSVFGPVGLLSKKWQDKYDYKIIKEKTIEGRKAFVIEAKPKMEIEGKPNYGKIWIDKEDFSILKIEIEQESLAGFERLEQQIKKRKIKPLFTITHNYFIEKEGIRFPSKTVFEEKYIGRRRRRIKASKTNITYDNYRFFVVDVKVIY